MTDLVQSVLILLLLLQVKHMFADYFLQTPKMLEGRDAYIHMGRAQHAGIHAVFSAICLLVMGTAPAVLAVLVIAEWVIHFHIDWGKASYSGKKGHTPQDAAFWRAAGFDQLLHQLTYLAMAAVWMATL